MLMGEVEAVVVGAGRLVVILGVAEEVIHVTTVTYPSEEGA